MPLAYLVSLTMWQEPNQEAVDCSACGSSGYAISGDLNLLESLIMKTDARYIIVVEKVVFSLKSNQTSLWIYDSFIQLNDICHAFVLKARNIPAIDRGSCI